MSNSNILKVKFDTGGYNNNKYYDFQYTESESKPFTDQQAQFLEGVGDIENKFAYHLYNIDTGLFILQTSDLKSCK
jgi:hypothetical protein